jgi:hypothetical protein
MLRRWFGVGSLRYRWPPARRSVNRQSTSASTSASASISSAGADQRALTGKREVCRAAVRALGLAPKPTAKKAQAHDILEEHEFVVVAWVFEQLLPLNDRGISDADLLDVADELTALLLQIAQSRVPPLPGAGPKAPSPVRAKAPDYLHRWANGIAALPRRVSKSAGPKSELTTLRKSLEAATCDQDLLAAWMALSPSAARRLILSCEEPLFKRLMPQKDALLHALDRVLCNLGPGCPPDLIADDAFRPLSVGGQSRLDLLFGRLSSRAARYSTRQVDTSRRNGKVSRREGPLITFSDAVRRRYGIMLCGPDNIYRLKKAKRAARLRNP